jgi:hypothetical protein
MVRDIQMTINTAKTLNSQPPMQSSPSLHQKKRQSLRWEPSMDRSLPGTSECRTSSVMRSHTLPDHLQVSVERWVKYHLLSIEDVTTMDSSSSDVHGYRQDLRTNCHLRIPLTWTSVGVYGIRFGPPTPEQLEAQGQDVYHRPLSLDERAVSLSPSLMPNLTRGLM